MNSGSGSGDAPMAAELVFALSERGQTVAIAESLTGGMLCSALVEVPGASAVVRGGVVSYATELKHRLLGVDAALLAANGPVDPDVAAQMAHGVRERLGADWGVSTTGVAGPDPQGGTAPGTVYIAVAGPLLSAGFVALESVVPGGAPIEAEQRDGESSVADPWPIEGVLDPAAQRINAWVLRLDLSGDRMAVRTATTRRAIDALLTVLREG
jgi:nicotinamide-nucleotide amidase